MMKFSSQLFLILPLAMGIGVAMAFQTAINAQLREQLHSPLQAALLSFFIGTIVLAIMVFFQSAEKPSLSEISNIPWLLWTGGFLGVYAISMSIYTAPKLGFLTFTGLVVFGQLVISMLLDSVHDKFHRTLILSGFCLLKIAKISLNSSFFPKPIKR